MIFIQDLKNKWITENINKFNPLDINTLHQFEVDNDIFLPNDLKQYFSFLNGTNEEYTDNLFEFYSLNKIKKVEDEFVNWNGIPNFKPLIEVQSIKNLFVFANYSFNLMAYAIKLSNNNLEKNEIYVLCGDEYKKIANNFTEFISLYLNDSMELFFKN